MATSATALYSDWDIGHSFLSNRRAAALEPPHDKAHKEAQTDQNGDDEHQRRDTEY